MDKIKSSELLEKIIYNSQKSMQSEDYQIKKAFYDECSGKMNDELKLVLKLIDLNNEFLRISFAKSTIQTLSDYGLIDNDINLSDFRVTNDILKTAIEKACKKS